MTQVVLATGNPGKIQEFNAALSSAGLEVCGLEALSDRTPVEEPGEPFEANARLKAEAYALRTDRVVLAEGSGREGDALGGDPGGGSQWRRATPRRPGVASGCPASTIERPLAAICAPSVSNRSRASRASPVLPRTKSGVSFDSSNSMRRPSATLVISIWS